MTVDKVAMIGIEQEVVPPISYPAFWNYTKLDHLSRLVPEGPSMHLIAVKEFLDNACDAAEKNGGEVRIWFMGTSLKITNVGALTKAQLAKLLDFSELTSEKYSKRAYIRGQIGHGFKIALMMVISEESNVLIRSDCHLHTLVLKKRMADRPNDVIGMVSTNVEDNGQTAVEFFVPHRLFSDVYAYINNYIAINPHISFKFNARTYKKTCELKKSVKADIFSYDLESFKIFSESYLSRGFSPEELLDIFNVPKIKAKQLSGSPLLDDIRFLYSLLRKNSKKMAVPVLGEMAIAKRVKDIYGYDCVDYKKTNLANGTIEVAVFSGDEPVMICGVNGSCLHEKTVVVNKLVSNGTLSMTLKGMAHEEKIKRPLFLLYHSTDPGYKDSNKQTVAIDDTKAYSSIKKIYNKHFRETAGNKDWLIAKDSYVRTAEKNLELRSAAHSLGVKPFIYCFLQDCKREAEALYEKFGQITLRQLYYRLISRRIIENSENSYGNFKGHMKTAREEGIIEYDIFEDRSRYSIFEALATVNNPPEAYVKEKLKESLMKPPINLWENQPYYVELWIEKDALVNLFAPIAKEKQVMLFPSRGYTSLTKIEQARKRFRAQIKKGKKVVILYAGDLDPSGWNIYENLINKFKKERGVKIYRFALNAGQVKGLHPMPVKKSDTRHKSFMEEHPDVRGAYELDAMDPETLRDLTRKEIEKRFNEKLVPKAEIAQWHNRFERVKKSIFEKISLD